MEGWNIRERTGSGRDQMLKIREKSDQILNFSTPWGNEFSPFYFFFSQNKPSTKKETHENNYCLLPTFSIISKNISASCSWSTNQKRDRNRKWPEHSLRHAPLADAGIWNWAFKHVEMTCLTPQSNFISHVPFGEKMSYWHSGSGGRRTEEKQDFIRRRRLGEDIWSKSPCHVYKSIHRFISGKQSCPTK